MTNHHIIAADQRLSQSLLWEIQRRYFLRNGMKAWQNDEVPHDISSNPVMARAYAQVVSGFLRDLNETDQRLEPIYIVELGAGSGRLAYHFLHQFFPRHQQSSLADWPIKYIMTDFVPEIVDFWQNHERFRPWIEAGVLDFALFDVLERRPLHLRHANITLDPNQIRQPLILIANYFFDSIPQDSFVIEEGQLCQNLLTLISSQPEPDLDDPAIWERLALAYEAIPLAEPPYEDDEYNQILAWYEAVLPEMLVPGETEAAVSFPNIGLDCIKYWRGAPNNPFLLLTADRGITLPDSLIGQEPPLPNLHGSFSLMVNYHAIGQYAELTGGQALYPAQYQDNLQVAAYVWGQGNGRFDKLNAGRYTRQAFADAIGNAGPDDFFALRQALEPHLDTLTLPQLLSYLRLNVWDADIFRDCFPALLTQTLAADSIWYEDIDLVLRQVWRQYLPLSEADNMADLIQQLRDVME